MRQADCYERKAREYLRLKGYRIARSNVRGPFGEIDIVAKKGEYTVFVEVKGRSARSLYPGRVAVTRRKRDSIRRTARALTARYPDRAYRFDVVEVTQGCLWRQYELIENAFGIDESI